MGERPLGIIGSSPTAQQTPQNAGVSQGTLPGDEPWALVLRDFPVGLHVLITRQSTGWRLPGGDSDMSVAEPLRHSFLKGTLTETVLDRLQ